MSAGILEPPPTSKTKAKAISKVAPKASGFAIAALTLGSIFADTSSCVLSPSDLDGSLDGMLDGHIAFNDFSVAGTCVGSSLQLPTWELSPVIYHLSHQDQLGCESSLFHPKTLQDWGLGRLDTSFFDPYLAEHESVVGQGEDETWILFDPGVAAKCCPPDFAPEFPLLQFDEKAPPLKSISGQILNIYGSKLVAFEIEDKRLWLNFYMNFYIWDVPYSVISVARLLQQGCKVTLNSEGSRFEGLSGESMPVVRYDSLLLCPKLDSFDPSEYSDFSTSFHAQFAVRPPPGLVAPTFKKTFQHHADYWELDSANHTLIRLHKRPRATLFSPEGTQDRPVELKDLAGERTTFMEFDNGSKISVIDNWMTSDDPKAKQPRHFKGKIIFKFASQRTGRKFVGKQSILKPPEPLESKPKPVQDPKRQVQVVPQPPQPTSKPVDPKLVQFQDIFRERLFQALAADRSYDRLESFVSKSLEDPDPQTGEAFTHDTWIELPTMWIRLHRLPRSTLFAPSEQLQGGPLSSDLSGVRVTITLDDYHGMAIQEDVWTADGEISSACEMIRGATCFDKKDLVVHEVPEVADPHLYESWARRPKGLPAPGEPTLTERREHELTHLLFGPGVPLVSVPRVSRIIAEL